MKSFTELSTEIKKREREQEKLDKEQRREDKQKIKFKADEEKVVSGVVAPREPIDKKAALLVSPAPWYAHAPQQPRREPEKPRPRRKKMKETHKEPPRSLNISADMRMHPEEYIDMDDLAVKLLAQIEKTAPKELSDIARSLMNAREAIREATNNIGGIMTDFDAVAKNAKESIRNTRYGIVSEAQSILKPLKEIRQFFLGPDYETERNRLKEFVELCERLQQLKESGFLDSVADTLLTLNAGSHSG